MSFDEVMSSLTAYGTEQNRKMYQRHGSGPDVYGVSFANLEKIRNRIGKDTQLARSLWVTGNADARCLATMIAEPTEMPEIELDSWAQSITYYVLADLFARNIVSLSPHGQSRIEAWIHSHHDLICQAGWNLVTIQAVQEDSLPDSYFEDHLKTIEANIRNGGNRTRHSMNAALIAIGMRNQRLHPIALAAAERIGRVDVDHGDSDNTTPDAVITLRQAFRKR